MVTKRCDVIGGSMIAARRQTFEHASTRDCLHEIMRLYHEQGAISQTLRHYYYMLIPDFIQIDPANATSKRNGYKFASRILTEARKTGVIPWHAVVDPGRRSGGMHQFFYDDIEEYVKLHSKPHYYLDPWIGQPCRILIGVESDGMLNMVSNWVDAYRMGVFVAKGYSSTTMNKDLSKHMGNGKGWVILYCGDFDPTGLDIECNLKRELRSYGCRPDIERVALLHDDLAHLDPAKRFIPPPKDTRRKKFQSEYGPAQMCFELETMHADVLRQRILVAIQRRMDIDKFNAAIELEREVNAYAPDLGKVMEEYGNSVLRGVPTSSLSHDEQLAYFQRPVEQQSTDHHLFDIDDLLRTIRSPLIEDDEDEEDNEDEE